MSGFPRLSSWLRRTVVAGVFALGAGTPALGQYASQGIDFKSQLTVTQLGGGAGGNGNSCWGYISPAGREIAIMGVNNRVAFVDITVPTAPVIKTFVAHTNSLWADVKVYGNYCYVTNESGGGMQVINMVNVDAGSVTNLAPVTSNGLSTAHTVALDETSGFVYPVGSSVAGSNGGLVAYSLANPAVPVYAGMWNVHYIHEAQVVTYTTGTYAGKQIAFCCIEDAGFAVVDVTNKAAMTTMAIRTYPGVTYCHQGWLSPDRRYFYIDDEIDGPAQGVTSTLTRIFDVQNLSNPVLVGTFTSGTPTSTDHNLYTLGRYIYESNYHSGIRVFDAINPTAPVEVAWLDTYPTDNASGYDGLWNNYPFFPSGNIVLSDIDRGMFVVKLNLNYLTFSYPSGLPAQVQPNTATPLTVAISNTGAALNPSTVVLHAKIDNGSFSNIPMSSIGGNQFQANLPATPCLSTVSFYVTASNTLGTSFSDPSNAPTGLNSALAYASKIVTLSYDMETAAGWVRDTVGDTAATGLWERGNPVGTGAQPEDDHSAAGVNCWATGLASGGSVGGNDIDGGKTTLFSPTINLAGADSSTRIGYWRWYSNNAGSAPNEDTFKVDISNNNGTSWVSVEVVGPAGAEVSGGWIRHEFRVADEVALTSTIKMRFIADDLINGSVVEAALDDFEVYRYDCGVTCPTVTQHPADQAVVEGASAAFSATATGGGTLTYQWRKGTTPLSNGGNISGATTTTLTIDPAAIGDAGQYNIVVTNSCGSVTSNSATLTVYCHADYNQDGFVDGIDADLFNNDFEAGLIAADYNGDGFVDGIDSDQFNNDFEAGC